MNGVRDGTIFVRALGARTEVLSLAVRGCSENGWDEGRETRFGSGGCELDRVRARSPTRRRGSSGRYLSSRKATELRSRPRRQPGRPEGVSGVVVEGGYGATVGETGPEEPNEPIVLRARIYDLVPVRELPYGPAAPSLHQRPDRRQHPMVGTRSRSGLERFTFLQKRSLC